MATTITITDRGASDHDFVPERANGREAFYRDWHESSTNAFSAHFMGSKTLLVGMDKASGKRPHTHRGVVRLNQPVGYEDVNGLAVPQGVARIATSIVIPVDMTLAYREWLLDIYKGFWAHTVAAQLIENLSCPS